jgi:hypothetical protein
MKFAWQANRGRSGPRTCCQRCGTLLQRKGHPTITVRPLFGKISLKSLRLRHCRCQAHWAAIFSPLTELLTERTLSQLRFMEMKWASLVSYGMTVKVLKDFLPIDEQLAASVRRLCKTLLPRCITGWWRGTG